MRSFVIVFLANLFVTIAWAQDNNTPVQDPAIEGRIQNLISKEFHTQLSEAFNFGKKFDTPPEPIRIFDVNLQYVQEMRGLMIWNASFNTPIYMITLSEFQPADSPPMIRISKNAENLASKIAMVKGIHSLVERKIIKIKLTSFKFKYDELAESGIPLKKLKVYGFTGHDLKEAGYPLEELIDLFSTSSLRIAGYTAKEFKDLGFTAYGLRAAGFLSEELEEAGF